MKGCEHRSLRRKLAVAMDMRTRKGFFYTAVICTECEATVRREGI